MQRDVVWLLTGLSIVLLVAALLPKNAQERVKLRRDSKIASTAASLVSLL